MGRAFVRELKQAMRVGTRLQASADESEHARASALALLERSIRCRHDRVAILRLVKAVQLGATVTSAQWRYCEQAMARAGDEALRARIIAAIGEPTSEQQASERQTIGRQAA